MTKFIFFMLLENFISPHQTWDIPKLFDVIQLMITLSRSVKCVDERQKMNVNRKALVTSPLSILSVGTLTISIEVL